ncbi:MAG: hypothetical protein BWX79_02335 [Alphaproteobacteria bacterium ADurb.Bin100]|nr:MAG: hypothetical protein BWX79_02335 [Alphaproteobacteria bacterium ADurb.Bin100]
MQLVEQPVQRLGQDGQPAVVLHQFQAGCQRFEHLFLLRTDKEARLHRLRASGGDVLDGGDHAHGIEVGIHLAHEVFANHTVGQKPGGRKVVLDHGDVTVGRILVDLLGLAFFDVAELDLLVLLGVGEDRRACEGGVERRLARRLVAVAHELQVQLGRDRRGAGVDHVVLHSDGVGTALEGVGLDQLDAAEIGRLELHHQLVDAVFQDPLAGYGHRGLVGRECAADQAGLRDIEAVLAFVQQHGRLLRVGHVGMLDELRLDDRAALGIQRQLEHVGGNDHALARRSRLCGRRSRRRWQLGGGSDSVRRRHPRRSRHRRSACRRGAGYGLGR